MNATNDNPKPRMTWNEFRGVLGFGPKVFSKTVGEIADEFERLGREDARLYRTLAGVIEADEGLKRALTITALVWFGMAIIWAIL